MSEVTIKVPTPLRSYVDGQSAVSVQAATVEEALSELADRDEELREQLFDDDGQLRRFVSVYRGEERAQPGEDTEAPLEDGEELRVVPSIAGGRDGVAAPAETQERPEPSPGEVEFSPEELRRYSRHLMIPEVGEKGQRRLKSTRVLLVGAGGLGSPAALYLAAAGVGEIGFVDHDEVELTNLQRQILHETPAVGEKKLVSARERLRRLNPEVEVTTHEARLTSENALELLEGWDLVLDGSDNFPTRYLINDACVFLDIPTVYGAIYRFEGQASVFGLEEGPCYRCLFPEPPPPGLVPSCADAGVLGVLPGIVGTIQATEAVKIALDAAEAEPLSGRLLLFDALKMEFETVSVERDPDCPVCGEHPTVTELIDYEAFCGLEDGGSAESEVPAVSVEDLRRWAEDGESFRLVDVREPYEWEICNLEELGAELIPQDELGERVDELRGEETVVVHCRSGGRSADAVRRLQAEGVDNALNLEGGILAWAREVDGEMPTY